MLSILLGSLNRLDNLKNLIANTLNENEFIELVIVDGGSTDGSIEYLKELNNDRITLINYGRKSSYSHFMNLAIQNSKHEFVCQWNDDALLVNNWSEVRDIVIKEKHDLHIFNWKLGKAISDLTKQSWLEGNTRKDGWNLEDKTSDRDMKKILTMNYGIYKKDIFREIGMYNTRFDFWYADGDLSNRAYYFGYKYKIHKNIKVFVLDTESKRKYKKRDKKIYDKNILSYQREKLPKGTKLFTD